MPVIDALHDAPDFGIAPAAHLLAALAPEYPARSVFLAVIDPGVGGKRDAIVVEADGRRFVGPDNGLFSLVWHRGRQRRCWSIRWRPERLTSSFHGRDLFAPVAAALATKVLRRWLQPKRRPDVLLDDRDLARVIYIDHYGNACTGLRYHRRSWRLRARGRSLAHACTFEEAEGPFWYENSMGLIEIAAPKTSAARALRLKVGSPVAWQTIYTIGHGARSTAALIELLKEAGIETLVDVRAFPSSKRHPHFSREPLEAALRDAGVAYDWQGKALGGYRKVPYVQHMKTGRFCDAAAALAARAGRPCILCAETNPDDCHRLHIADWLARRGHRVIHLLAPGRPREHALNPQEELWRED